jgi:aarF domain-containing kinase
LFAISLGDLAAGLVGKDAATVLTGDAFLEPEAVAALFLSIVSTGELPIGNSPEIRSLAANARDSLRTVTPEGEDAEEQSIDDLLAAVQALSPEDRKVLQDTTSRVVGRVYEKFCARLVPLTGGAPVATSGVDVAPAMSR